MQNHNLHAIEEVDDLTTIILDLSELNQTYPNWIKLVQIGSNLSKLDQTCPNWIKPVQFG